MAFRNRVACYICGRVAAFRNMVRIDGDNILKREISISRREATTRICSNCNISIVNEIRQLEEDPSCLVLNVLSQTSSHSCLICNRVGNIHRLSIECRVKVFIDMNIYIQEYAKSCLHQLGEDGFLLPVLLPGLRFVNRPYVIRGPQLSDFLQALRNAATNRVRPFHDINSFDDTEFVTLTSLTKEQFRELHTFCDAVVVSNRRRDVSTKDLTTFLCKLRQGLSDEFLKLIFQYSSRQAVSLAITTVRLSLMRQFVTRNIGFRAITRNNYIEQHVTEFCNILYNSEPDVPIPIAFIDGTYSEVEKSSNYRFLRQSFCVHKGCHLVKPVLIVASDGYILDIQGPYFSDSRNNDAQMLRNEFQRDMEGMRAWMLEDTGTILVVDRGYRDATELLQELGITYHMPSLLPFGQRQLTTEEANSSRLVTMSRWVNEARNGHIKSIYKFFDRVIPTAHLSHLGDLYRITGALINRYRNRIVRQGADAALAREVLNRDQEANVLQARIEKDQLYNRAANWTRLNQTHVPDFPRLTLEYLRQLTFGVYQIKLAPSYIQDKMQREGTEIFQFDENRNERGLLRFRIFSRFRNAGKYQLWIAYRIDGNVEAEDEAADEAEHEADDPPIVGYYCQCKSGARNVGTCSHIASVIWFLGYARHTEDVRYPSVSLLKQILDAANRGQPNHPMNQ